ncbi:hypothetical protein O6H91_17G059400 [Diphasiastrum complanatum]|uniref:Uncharacterized protein n=2 Tax=Diphasiastrum complanatum TaxID=34168 RepID=A0ACC2B788_DIPCM|nr:hypothetical protein O6H91_17G059300 [Diphasiastrum complanatum]KAJ7525621.1 hypothetical protein O6H91_17G059400 [Diphasiastrum complanatum]
MDSRFRAFLVGMLLLQCLHFSPVMAADPDPLVDFSPDAHNFTLRNIFMNGDVSHGPGGTRAALDTKIFPATTSQGITYVQFKMVPCGINLPHTHPRAAELLTLVSGGPLQVGFVDTNGVAHIDILYPGDVTVFPRGMLHFEQNVGKTIAFYISALDSQNPGTLTSAGALFQLPTVALATTLNQTGAAVTAINSTLYTYGPSLQMSSVSGCVPGRY